MTPIDRKLLALAIATSAIATVLTFFLASAKVTQVVRQVQVDRLALLLKQVETVAENSLSLGIAVPEMRPLAQTLKRQLSADSSIVNVDVYLPSGVIAHAANPERVGMVLATDPMCTARAKEITAVFEYANVIRVARSITNSFDAIEACAVLEFDAGLLAEHSRKAKGVLGLACGIAFVLGSIALFFGLRRSLQRFAATLENAANQTVPVHRLSVDSARWRALFATYAAHAPRSALHGVPPGAPSGVSSVAAP